MYRRIKGQKKLTDKTDKKKERIYHKSVKHSALNKAVDISCNNDFCKIPYCI